MNDRELGAWLRANSDEFQFGALLIALNVRRSDLAVLLSKDVPQFALGDQIQQKATLDAIVLGMNKK
jgi:hypothetical protein